MKRQRDDILDELQVKRAKFRKIEREENAVKSSLKQLEYELNGLIGINRFPAELMNMILRRLEISDLFKCELVCRRWNEFVKAFDQSELIICDQEERKPRKWKFNKKTHCSPKSIIIRSDLHFVDLENSFLIELRRLKIINHKLDFKSSTEFDQISLLTDLNFINKLVNLETLEVKTVDLEEEDEAILTLPNLRYLAISRLHSKLKLATPKLTNYQGRSLEQIKFVFKEKITSLCVDKYCLSLKQLNNLQYLCVKNDGFLMETDQYSCEHQFLDNHANLKKLSFRPGFRRLCQEAYRSAKSSALQILEQKKRLKRDEFKLIFFGVQLEDANQLFDFNYSHKEDLVKLHLLNYSALCANELRWVKRVNFSCLLRCMSDGLVIPPDFYEKYDQVEEVVIDYHIADEQIDILKNFKGLNSLIVYGKPYLQPTNWRKNLETIADAFPEIWSVKLNSLDYEEIGQLDCIFKLTKLRRLQTDCRYYDGFLSRLFQKHDVFETTFVENGTDLKVIRRSADSNLELWCRVRYDWTFHLDFEDISDLYEEIYRSFAD